MNVYDIYDLYDLSAIFLNIRALPTYSLNHEILTAVLDVLENGSGEDNNRFRRALRTIDGLDSERFRFAYVNNVYVYFPTMLKDDCVCAALIAGCQHLKKAVAQQDFSQVWDLADSLHNLPIYIAENHMQIPRQFWKNEVKSFKKKWKYDFTS